MDYTVLNNLYESRLCPAQHPVSHPLHHNMEAEYRPTLILRSINLHSGRLPGLSEADRNLLWLRVHTTKPDTLWPNKSLTIVFLFHCGDERGRPGLFCTKFNPAQEPKPWHASVLSHPMMSPGNNTQRSHGLKALQRTPVHPGASWGQYWPQATFMYSRRCLINSDFKDIYSRLVCLGRAADSSSVRPPLLPSW